MTSPARDPLVSVILPTRNRRHLLSLALASVCSQTVREIEVIVADDASTDDTHEFLAQFGDPRLLGVRNALPRGSAAARNAGLAIARGRWTAFLDDDDLWAPEKIAAQLHAIRRATGARWACVGTVRIDERFRILGWHRLQRTDDLLPSLLRTNMIPGSASSVIVETSLLRDLGGFREDLQGSEDWDCWIRVAGATPLATVDLPLVAYRISPTTKSHTLGLEQAAHRVIRSRYQDVAERYGVESDLESEIRYLARQDLRAGRRSLAVRRFLGLAHERHRYVLWAAGSAVLPRNWELVWTRLREPVTAPGWRRNAQRWLAPYRDANEVSHAIAQAPRPERGIASPTLPRNANR
jgi:glycosyltransferase involved in cell wall biosynthesis